MDMRNASEGICPESIRVGGLAVAGEQENDLSTNINDATRDGSKSNIQRLSRSQPLSAFIKALETNGCVIVTDFTDIPTLETAEDEVRPILEGQSTGAKVGGKSIQCEVYSFAKIKER